MNAGTASGATNSGRQAERPGRSVRSTSQAAPTPSRRHSGTVTTTRPTVLTSSSPTRGRASSSYTGPGPSDATDHATYPSGTNVAATSSTMPALSTGPGRAFGD